MRSILKDPTADEFAWSPDGRRVAFHSRRDGQWGIWLMDRDGVTSTAAPASVDRPPALQ
jgi:Tol biopolymer transport system component